jgi:long-chain acyl-CoA synthetase
MSEAAPWPARSVAESIALLTAPGAPFEMRTAQVGGRTVRAYVHAKRDLRQIFDESRRFGERDLLLFEGERLSFEAHWRAAAAFGRALIEAFGVAKGDRVALAMRNFPEWSICAWGALAVGAVLAPLNAWEPGRSLAGMVRDSDAKVLVVDAERLARLAPEIPGLGDVAVIVARGGGEAVAGERLLTDLIGPPSGYAELPDAPLPDPGVSPDDPATLFFTSGTTGTSKGALGSHRNVVTNLVNTGFRAARAAVRRGEPHPPLSPAAPARRVQLLPLPFFHVTGFHSALVPALANGATLALMYRWDAAAALALIEREQIAVLTLVPTQAWQLVDEAEGGGRALGSVEAVGYGGAAAAPELAARVRNVFPNAFPGQGYGATETSSLVAANSHEDMMNRPGSVGIAVPCCDLRVADAGGRDVAPGQAGELWVSGPNVIQGYWNAPAATEEAFAGGWYRTGDIVRIDAEGFVTVLDRVKDMLIRGGENIYCVEIEDVLMSHGAVAEAAVLGVPDRVMGEVVGAIVRLRAGMTCEPRELIDYVGERLAAHKVPAILRVRSEPFPRNATGKTLKRDLREEMLGP